RLGRRGAPGHRGADQHLARRAHGHGDEPALRRPGDDGDEDLRPPVRLAELDLPAPQRGGREGRAHSLWEAGKTQVQLDANVTTEEHRDTETQRDSGFVLCASVPLWSKLRERR